MAPSRITKAQIATLRELTRAARRRAGVGSDAWYDAQNLEVALADIYEDAILVSVHEYQSAFAGSAPTT